MAATLIECKLHRPGGSIIDMVTAQYNFVPYTDGAHVCEVDNDEHVDRFLSIPEGYCLYRGDGQPIDELVQTVEAASDTDRAALVAEYTRIFGEAPHPRLGIKKLTEAIAGQQ